MHCHEPAHCVARLGLIVGLGIGSNRKREIQGREVGNNALIAIGGPEMSVRDAFGALHPGVVTQIERSQPIAGGTGRSVPDREERETERPSSP